MLLLFSAVAALALLGAATNQAFCEESGDCHMLSSENVLLVTTSDVPSEHIELLQKSSSRVGLHLTILGQNEAQNCE